MEHRQEKLRSGILLPKLFWHTVRKDCSRDREKHLKFETEGQDFAKLNSENSEQSMFFYNLFLEVSHIE